jgi:hypothetical protein
VLSPAGSNRVARARAVALPSDVPGVKADCRRG